MGKEGEGRKVMAPRHLGRSGAIDTNPAYPVFSLPLSHRTLLWFRGGGNTQLNPHKPGGWQGQFWERQHPAWACECGCGRLALKGPETSGHHASSGSGLPRCQEQSGLRIEA